MCKKNLQKDESQSADHDPASDEEEAKQMLAKLKTMAQQGESAAAQEAKENEEEIRKQASFFVDLTQVGCLLVLHYAVQYFSCVISDQAYMRKVVIVNLKDMVPKLILSGLIHQTIKHYLSPRGPFMAEMLSERQNLKLIELLCHTCKFFFAKQGSAESEKMEALVRRDPKVEELLEQRRKLDKVKRVVLDTRDMDRALRAKGAAAN